ncbi:UNVERIFIED_CONTAM: hypothetical protein FKN15_059861 [Acipenser sinensis]
MDQKDTEMNEKGISSSTSGVVVQVREKKGPLRAAIPYMPFPVAVICLFLNTFVPGLDTEMNEKGISSSTSGVVVQVREKKGPLRAAIPYMPFPVAVICLFLNTFVPGLGTFVSAFTVLCGAQTDLPNRHVCCVFWLNIAAAFIQILTAVVMVGWIMSIFWGMDMVIMAILLKLAFTRYCRFAVSRVGQQGFPHSGSRGPEEDALTHKVSALLWKPSSPAASGP